MKKLGAEHLEFLDILSDGKTRTYVHFMRKMGKPITPMSPTIVNKLARPLRRQGLVKQKMGGGYKITNKGLEMLKALKG
jgi:predicted transcriptional regulator